MLNIVVLVSGGGTNLQALMDACEAGTVSNGKISCVISSRADAYALERAGKHGIPGIVLERKAYPDNAQYSRALLEELKRQKADLIVLAGFMVILNRMITDAFPYQIINVHPALIPSFCGEGYYGLRVHQAALDYGVKLTGATVHFVNEKADAGAIILQKAVAVQNGDTPESLQKRVMEQAEWEILPKAVSLFCEGRIAVKDGKAYIKEGR